MKPENHRERKKILYQFGALYLGALVLMALAFAFLNGQPAAGMGGEPSSGGPGSLTKDAWANRANGILLKNRMILQQLDDQYDKLLADSAGRIRLADADKMIGLAENAFANDIDSLERQGSEYTLFTAACRTLLDNRRTLSNFRAALATGRHWPGAEQQELIRLQQQLAQKDKDLSALENRRTNPYLPEDGQASAAAASQVTANLRNDNRSLQTALDEQRRNNEGLREMIISLRRSNESMNTRLTDGGKQTGGTESGTGSLMMTGGGGTAGSGVAGNRNRTLEQRSAELAAELSFAQVDCNLTRADAKQTIYNSRQRKDLLADALTVLTELSRSEDGTVQQKAREKLARLRSIAAAVHD